MANMVASLVIAFVLSPYLILSYTVYKVLAGLAYASSVVRRAVGTMVSVVKHCCGDIKAGVRVVSREVSFSWFVIVLVSVFLSSVFVGFVPTITIYSILLLCIGSRYGGRVPRYVVLHWERIKKAWECGVDDDDCTTPLASVCMERVSVKLRPRLACKVAVKAISKVGLLKRSEANALVYQRVCLDVMEGMKMRWHDRLMILPQAVLACLERPDEVEEVMKAIEASCKGRFDDF
jgi:hypothetical protein